MKRPALVTGACLVALLVGVGGRAASGHHHSPRDPDLEAALKAAHQVQGTVTGTFLVATYLGPRDKRVRQSNTGHPCTSGRVVEVRLLWDADASFTHGGVPGAPPDGPHKALIATADAATGVVCLVGASYVDDEPEPGETYLFGPRRDLVSPR